MDEEDGKESRRNGGTSGETRVKGETSGMYGRGKRGACACEGVGGVTRRVCERGEA